jgi:hypothetical protein
MEKGGGKRGAVSGTLLLLLLLLPPPFYICAHKSHGDIRLSLYCTSRERKVKPLARTGAIQNKSSIKAKSLCMYLL